MGALYERVLFYRPAMTIAHDSDKELLVSPDEDAAFKVIYDRYWEGLYKKAIHRLGNDADAQDVVQEVFISLWKNRTAIEVEYSLEAYLFTALKYAIIKLVTRKAKKGVMLPLSVEQLEQTELTSEELLLYKELKEVVAKKVNELPERMQEVYKLSRVEHLSTYEIAQRLNLSEQTVKNTISTALKKLREGLGDYGCWILFFI